ncbi:MAG: class I SAM-dependent methyltransferase [Candidatus Hydrogenedentes bacterium]|nr:class I SAM-dependent methyltransferase [Candidatus Hydrogenedentota bacterium]
MDEKEFIEQVGKTYTKGSSQDKVIRSLIVRTFKPYISGGMYCLQLGYGCGIDTAELARLVRYLYVAEGNMDFIKEGKSRRRLSNVEFVHTLFEDLSLEKMKRQFDAVFAIYVLEHVLDPMDLLKRIKQLIKSDGYLFVVVPNAYALSRQLARYMGLIKELTDLTENDLRHGHRRVYDIARLNRELCTAGYKIIHQGGIFLKILADFQLDQLYQLGILGKSQIEGLYKLGLEYPHLCGSIFAVARKEG